MRRSPQPLPGLSLARPPSHTFKGCVSESLRESRGFAARLNPVCQRQLGKLWGASPPLNEVLPPQTNKCSGILLLTQIESVTSCWQNCLVFCASHKMSSPTPAAEAVFCSVQGWVGAPECSQTQSQTSRSPPTLFLRSKQLSTDSSALCFPRPPSG